MFKHNLQQDNKTKEFNSFKTMYTRTVVSTGENSLQFFKAMQTFLTTLLLSILNLLRSSVVRTSIASTWTSCATCVKDFAKLKKKKKRY